MNLFEDFGWIKLNCVDDFTWNSLGKYQSQSKANRHHIHHPSE